MYIQMTTKCNMTCAHCCFAATKSGTNMTREVFVNALIVARDYGMSLTLGGGEPTMHPQFFDLFGIAREMSIEGSFEFGLHIVTNGLYAGKARRLLRIAETDYEQEINSRISLELSIDRWHDPIDQDIYGRYMVHHARREQYRRMWNRRDNGPADIGVRTVPYISPNGRGKHHQFDGQRQAGFDCACDTMLVDPVGDLWACGCKKTKVGHISDIGSVDPRFFDDGHAEQFTEAMEAAECQPTTN